MNLWFSRILLNYLYRINFVQPKCIGWLLEYKFSVYKNDFERSDIFFEDIQLWIIIILT